MITTADLGFAALVAADLIITVLVWYLTRAWYLGRLEDNGRLIHRMKKDLKAADALVKDLEDRGLIACDRPRGRHER